MIKETYNSGDKVCHFLFAAYLIFKPFYWWSSGLPQVSDFIFVLLVVSLLFYKKFNVFIRGKSQKLVVYSAVFSLYILFVNSIWTVLLNSDTSMLFTSIYYIYNSLVLIITIILFQLYGSYFLRIIFSSTVLSVGIQITSFILSGGFTGIRQIGNFNNPNQLGYFGILSLCILIFVGNRILLNRFVYFFSLFFASVLTLASLSKAAIVSLFVLFLTFFVSRSSNKKLKTGLFILILVFMVLFFILEEFAIFSFLDIPLVKSVNSRLEAIGQDSDDSLEGRGYYRILYYPNYWIFGAGEGEYPRFGSKGMEFHSTLGNIQVSYGIIGLVLFAIILRLALKMSNRQEAYLLFVLLLYGLTHNGVRNTLLWILIALFGTDLESSRYCRVINGKRNLKYDL